MAAPPQTEVRDLFSLIYNSESQCSLPQSCNTKCELAQVTPAFHSASASHQGGTWRAEKQAAGVNVFIRDARPAFVGIFLKNLHFCQEHRETKKNCRQDLMSSYWEKQLKWYFLICFCCCSCPSRLRKMVTASPGISKQYQLTLPIFLILCQQTGDSSPL